MRFVGSFVWSGFGSLDLFGLGQAGRGGCVAPRADVCASVDGVRRARTSCVPTSSRIAPKIRSRFDPSAGAMCRSRQAHSRASQQAGARRACSTSKCSSSKLNASDTSRCSASAFGVPSVGAFPAQIPMRDRVPGHERHQTETTLLLSHHPRSARALLARARDSGRTRSPFALCPSASKLRTGSP